MAVKSKGKSKTIVKAKKASGKRKTSMAQSSRKKLEAKPKSIVLTKRNESPSTKSKSLTTTKVRVVHTVLPARILKGARKSSKGLRLPQYNYMKPPGITHDFQVGDTVEVYCDHEKNRDRVRGWIRGVIVQVDNKLVAVQFRSNVYLTDGWMVPDRILWYPLNSEHMKPIPGKKSANREVMAIPNY